MKKTATIAPKHRKPGKSPTKPARPQPSIEQRENWYTPTLADWDIEPNRKDPSSCRSFTLRDDAAGPSCRLDIARIEIPEHFSDQDANRIACLIGNAPKLWRLLREVAPAALNDGEDMRLFNEAVECLSEAAERYPYEWPHAHHQDEAIMVMSNRCRGRFTNTNPVRPVLPEEV